MMLFLTLRVMHVLLAAIWFGAIVANVFFLTPSVMEAKSGGQVMAGMMRRGYVTFLTAISGIVTLTGFYLYYKFTLGFDPIASAAMPARIVGTGAVAGLLASVFGPMFVNRPIKRVAAIMAKAGPMADGAEKSALLQQSAALQASSILWSQITLVLMTIALVTMSIGHYFG
ncbi:MAG: hypothetical protein WCQ64_09930 [Acidobacteriota bacterium]